MVEKLKPPFNPYRLMCEPQDFGSKTDLVVIRQPNRHVVSQGGFQAFAQKLCNLGFAPLSICPVSNGEDDYRIFPTDSFREIAGNLVTSAIYDWKQVLLFLKNNYFALYSRLNNLPIHEQSQLVGGNFLYSPPVFIYASNNVYKPLQYAPPSTFFEDLINWGYEPIPIDTTGIALYPNKRLNPPDLDFLLSIYAGEDGNLHAIVAQAFMERIAAYSQKLDLHPIPNDEAIHGGCNIADLGNGKVLVLPKPDKTPTTHLIIKQYPPKAKVLISPFDVYHGGGPRCSMSSVSLG